MTILDKETPVQTNGFVQVAVLGGDVHTIDFVDGLTISQALEQSEITVEPGQVITMNGRPIDNLDQPLEPDSVLSVVSRVKNG